MIKIYVYACLLSALSVVEMKPVNINGRVGERLTFNCSDWNIWFGVIYNVKYFCRNPCTEDKHIIVKAAFERTESKNRIKLTNRAEGLFVTFTELQKSDSNTYYCGVERLGSDPLIKVNLKVLDAKSSSPKTVSFDATNSFTMSSRNSEITADTSTSYMTLNTTPTASATQGAGNLPYLIAGLFSMITAVMLRLILIRKRKQKQPMVVSTPQEDAREGDGAAPDGVYQSLHPLTMDKDQVYSTLTPTGRNAALK